MSEETLDPPLPPIDARTEAVAERLFGLKWALRKDSTEIIHEEWRTASKWIRDGYLRPSGTRERQGLRLPGPHACRIP